MNTGDFAAMTGGAAKIWPALSGRVGAVLVVFFQPIEKTEEFLGNGFLDHAIELVVKALSDPCLYYRVHANLTRLQNSLQ
nr:hypothetical protein [Gluconacetobacter sacchari]